MPATRFFCVCLGLLLVLLFPIGCSTETDDLLFVDIGLARLLPVDTGQRRQDISIVDSGRPGLLGPPGPYQVTEWTLSAANLELNGKIYDLLFGGGRSCSVVQTTAIVPIVSEPCDSGIVIEALDQPQTASLTLAVESMQVRRAKPKPEPDFDNDGIPIGSNPCVGGSTYLCSDNCPLVYNPLQEDPNRDGVGAVCEVVDSFTGARFPDNDLDGVADFQDNCVWESNPGQENTMGLSELGLPDGIGDACIEQIAEVRVDGSTSFQFQLDSVDLIQSLLQVSYLTIEFNGQEALECDWDAETCSLKANQVGFCARSSLRGALDGC